MVNGFPDNSDLLAVTVTPTASASKSNTGGRQRRFLVVDIYQIVLVEPDATRLGWGVATFVGFLQDLEVVTDKEDSRCLHVTVHSPRSSLNTAAASHVLIVGLDGLYQQLLLVGGHL